MDGACDGQHEKISRHRLRVLKEVLRVIDEALEGVEPSGEPAWVSVWEARESA
ncbi:hypothetical protein [Infirmifilum sp. SLHALR2]